MVRRICVVTGSRAEYGLLRWLIQDLARAPGVELQLAVTGSHLANEFGLTVREIEADGVPIAARVEMLLSSDTPAGLAKSIALGVAGFADAFARLRPELLVLLGDRFEILAAAQAALVANIPIAHIAGGDVTEGAFDEAIRHSITKMSHLHFVTSEASARRVRQLGEEPSRIHVVGSPGIDGIRRLPLLGREELEAGLGIRFLERNLLITYHPETLAEAGPETQFSELLAALEPLGPRFGLFFTMPNADTGGRALARMVGDFVAAHPQAAAFPSLGQQRYLSLMRAVDAVVGNSSSGLLEAPSFGKPTVNIGDRQRGRLEAESVLNTQAERTAITNAIRAALVRDCSRVVNPYGDGHASSRILEVLLAMKDPRTLIRKRFIDIAKA